MTFDYKLKTKFEYDYKEPVNQTPSSANKGNFGHVTIFTLSFDNTVMIIIRYINIRH